MFSSWAAYRDILQNGNIRARWIIERYIPEFNIARDTRKGPPDVVLGSINLRWPVDDRFEFLESGSSGIKYLQKRSRLAQNKGG